jgi:hypothetical protein
MMQANGCGSKAEEWPQRVQCNANLTLVLCIVIICIHMRYWSGISHSHEVLERYLVVLLRIVTRRAKKGK